MTRQTAGAPSHSRSTDDIGYRAATYEIDLAGLSLMRLLGGTLIKIPVYDEPEGVVFLVVDDVLLLLLLLALRVARSQATGSGQVRVVA